MNAQALLQDIYQQVGIKQLAAQLGVSTSLLYKWLGQGDSHRMNPVDRVAQLFRVTQDRRLVDMVCRLAGGHFVAEPPVQRRRASRRPELSCRVMRELAQLQAAVAERLPARDWSPAQTAAALELWDALRSDMEPLLRPGGDHRPEHGRN